jgi:hypothetical protein
MYVARKTDLIEKCYSLQALDVVSLECSVKVLKYILVTIHLEAMEHRHLPKLNTCSFSKRVAISGTHQSI